MRTVRENVKFAQWYEEPRHHIKNAAFGLTAICLSLVSGAANANGYAQPQAQAAQVVAPAVALDWSGAYVGGTLSYFRGSMPFCDNGFAGYECDDLQIDTPAPEASGGMIGLTAGYDWQNGAIVYGVVGDLMFGDLSGSAPSNGLYGCGVGCDLEIDGLAMIRGRVGYAMDSYLLFGSLGVAATRVSVGETGLSSTDGTVTNLVVGLGGEYMVTNTMSVGMELLHFVENSDPVIDDAFCGAGFCGGTDFSATGLRLSVNYRF